ncbi:MAG: Trk system potassium transporter TrkA [Xanthomonadales bacterium]|nr:Trk system potassium transporter TrkA [Xanthomonadales bacterium]
MKIIILGAGQVGSSVASRLSREENDITVVDVDPGKLRELQDKLDIRGVVGNASHPRVLTRAGAEDADMIVAVTNSDEINMIACQVAYTIFQTPTKIARVRAGEYLDYPELFSGEHCPVDVLISPERLVTDYVRHLIEYPGALQVLDFADGRAQLVAVEIGSNDVLTGLRIRDLSKVLSSGKEIRVAGIFRHEMPIIPDGDTAMTVGDTVFFLAARQDIRGVMEELRELESPVRRVIIAGGGNIGLNLAAALEDRYHVKIIERGKERAEQIAEELEKSIVLRGDCTDEDLLREENIDQTDVYCALTDDDEANVLSSMLAKRLGARKVLSLVNRMSYVDMIEAGTIDIAISPQQITIGGLLTHVRKGHMVRVHSLRRGAAEAIEAVAHGDAGSSRVVGRTIEEIELPSGATIGGIIRGEDLIIAHHDTKVESEDHVVLFVVDRRSIGEIERLFQVGVTFM